MCLVTSTYSSFQVLPSNFRAVPATSGTMRDIFRIKAMAEDYARGKLHDSPLDVPFKDDILKRVVSYPPLSIEPQSVKCFISTFYFPDDYDVPVRVLKVQTVDGVWRRIRWKRCIQVAYKRESTTIERVYAGWHKDDLEAAFREAPKSVLAFKKEHIYDENDSTRYREDACCVECGSRHDLCADHRDPEFKVIKAEFIRLNNLVLEDIPVHNDDERCSTVFADEEMRTKFANFHDAVATFQILCRSCNSSRYHRNRLTTASTSRT